MLDILDNEEYKTASVGENFDRLCKIAKKLRSPGGCPWDKEQTPQTLRQPLIEECYEVVDAINQKDSDHVREELGDVLLNVVMLSTVYEENGSFDISASLREVCEKIIRRHPHVWPPKLSENNTTEQKTVEHSKSSKIKTSEEVLNQWEIIKQKIEGRKKKCSLDEVSYGLPPLLRAQKIQKKAAKKGFDWDCTQPVWDKIYEELDELKEACNAKNLDNMEEELGDVLFAVVNLARKLNIDSELALSKTNQKFRNRFAFVQEKMEENGISMEQKNLKQMDEFWELSKIEPEK
ncbi:MAG: nucleoside triphosphate pyrophosphohydrolase [Treponemataceae bacterium]